MQLQGPHPVLHVQKDSNVQMMVWTHRLLALPGSISQVLGRPNVLTALQVCALLSCTSPKIILPFDALTFELNISIFLQNF